MIERGRQAPKVRAQVGVGPERGVCGHHSRLKSRTGGNLPHRTGYADAETSRHQMDLFGKIRGDAVVSRPDLVPSRPGVESDEVDGREVLAVYVQPMSCCRGDTGEGHLSTLPRQRSPGDQEMAADIIGGVIDLDGAVCALAQAAYRAAPQGAGQISIQPTAFQRFASGEEPAVTDRDGFQGDVHGDSVQTDRAWRPCLASPGDDGRPVDPLWTTKGAGSTQKTGTLPRKFRG